MLLFIYLRLERIFIYLTGICCFEPLFTPLIVFSNIVHLFIYSFFFLLFFLYCVDESAKLLNNRDRFPRKKTPIAIDKADNCR